MRRPRFHNLGFRHICTEGGPIDKPAEKLIKDCRCRLAGCFDDARPLVIPSVHMKSIASVRPGEGSSSVALLKVSSLFFPVKGFLLFLGVFPDPMRSWDRDVVCVQIVKPSEENL